MGSRPLSDSANHADVVIIGGGLHGCSAALHLALRCASVIVLEKDYAGRHASGVNAGGVRRLGRALPEIPLSVASARIWSEIEGLVGDDCGFEPSRHIKVAETEAELAELEARAAEVRDLGFNHEQIIDRDTLRRLLPAIAPHCLGAMIVEGDGHAHPFRTVQAFRRRCVALGGQFREGSEVRQIRRENGNWRVRTGDGDFEAPNLLNCAGAWEAGLQGCLVNSRPSGQRRRC